MRILQVLWRNLRKGPQTLRYPAHPAAPRGFRGRVQFDPERCSGCGVCKFRCEPRAITFTPGKGEFTWAYNPGQCTFCGRCVEGCKQGALSQEAAPPPIYTTPGELAESHTLTRKPPARKAAPQAAASNSETTQPVAVEAPSAPSTAVAAGAAQ